jgi:Protein of unknown function (DUF1656)
MIGELDLHGVLVPPLLLSLLLALAASAVLRRLLARAGFYRLVWHRPLFDLALFVILTGGIAAILARWAGLAGPAF